MSIIDTYIAFKQLEYVTGSSLKKQVQKQSNFLTLNQAGQLIRDIGNQVKFMKNKGWGIVGVSVDSIEIRNETYLITDTSVLYQIRNGELFINRPVPVLEQYFMSPEVISISYLPSYIPIQTIYYSCAKLILKYLTGRDNMNGLEELKNLPIYYFIDRCLKTDPTKRKYILL